MVFKRNQPLSAITLPGTVNLNSSLPVSPRPASLYITLGVSLAAFLIPFIVYLVTLNPALFRNDSPEVVVGCVGLGIIHAPGYPLFILIGRLFSLFPIGNPAMTLNLFAAFLGGFATLLFFLNARLFLNRPSFFDLTSPSPTHMELICLFSALNFGLSQTFWSNSLVSKGGIYVLQIVLELSLVLTTQIFLAKEKKPKPSIFLLFLFIFALGFCNHWPTQAFLGFLVASAALFSRANKQKLDLSPKQIILGFSQSIFALSLYLYLPIRAFAKPIIDFGAPTNLFRFLETITRMNYLKVETLATAPVGSYLSLFYKMEYISNHTLREFCPFFLFFVLAGSYFLFKRDKPLCLSAVGLMALVLVTNIFYLQATPIEYWHIADHLLTNNWVIGFLGCIGLFSLFSKINRFGKHLLLFCLLAMVPLVYLNGIQANNQTRQFLYVGYGLTALKSLPLDSIYFSENDYDYFSALYLTETLQLRPDIHLILTPFLDKVYQFDNALERVKPLFAKQSDVFSKEQVYRCVTNTDFGHPLYCTFPDAYFSTSYLASHSRLAFEPHDLLTHILNPSEKPIPKSDFYFLRDFQEHYLDPEIFNPNEINGLLKEICAYPLLNAAKYETVFGNTQHRDWYFVSALELISEPNFFNTVIREYKNKTTR